MNVVRDSMMWTTTYAVGAFFFGAVLAYLAFHVGTDPDHGLVLRVVLASALMGAGLTILVKVVRALTSGSMGREQQ
jgi:hypothetical protein